MHLGPQGSGHTGASFEPQLPFEPAPVGLPSDPLFGETCPSYFQYLDLRSPRLFDPCLLQVTHSDCGPKVELAGRWDGEKE